ncbi:MAG TPA: prephenate/arogenate dehydrogenase family protein, partial [Hyphomonas sp.]|nr:prephenate/arogenate dehydrogenase family protein [Hyphomonas sp.]
MTDPVFPRIAIIGAGLIGSSIARAAREYGAAGEIALYDAAEDVRAR